MNIQQIMKQAQQMQKKLQEGQAALEKKEFVGTANNGDVSITIMGTGLVKSINIKEDLIDKDDKEILEDLLVVAFNDARKKLDEESSSTMNAATGGMNLNNFKLPF